MLEHFAKQKNINVELDYQSDVKFFRSVFGDKDRYMQVLLNFLSYSLKMSPSNGKVKIALKIRA